LTVKGREVVLIHGGNHLDKSDHDLLLVSCFMKLSSCRHVLAQSPGQITSNHNGFGLQGQVSDFPRPFQPGGVSCTTTRRYFGSGTITNSCLLVRSRNSFSSSCIKTLVPSTTTGDHQLFPSDPPLSPDPAPSRRQR
jgi:hypothetical protein